jgi:hypothetical protein
MNLIKLLLIIILSGAFLNSYADITSAGSGNWSSGSTWVGGIVPDSTQNVIIAATHTITVDVGTAACNNISFFATTSHLSMGSANSVLSVYGNFTLFSISHNVFNTLWTAGAKIIFTGGAATQTLSGWSSTASSTSFMEMIVDKWNGKIVTAGTNMRFSWGTSLEIKNGTFELASTDDIETRNISGTGTAATLTVDAGAVFNIVGSTSYYRQGTITDPETGKSGLMTVYGTANLAGGSTTRINLVGINIENGGLVEVPTGASTVASTFNVGTVTIKNGGIFKNDITTLYWYTNTTTATTLIINSGGEFNSASGSVTPLPQVVTVNDGSIVRYSNNSGSTLPAGITTYSNLYLSGTSTPNVKTLGVNTTVNGTLSIRGTSTFSLGTFTLTYGSSAILQYGSSGQVTVQTTSDAEFPAVNGPQNLSIYNSGGVTLHANRTIPGTFTLTNGLFNTTSSNMLTLGISATVAGGSNTSFVNGPIAVTARNTIPMVAPVGKGSAYRPLTSTLSITSGSGTFTVEQFETPPTGSISVSGVASLSPTRYFHITKTGTVTGSATLTLTWGADDGVVFPSSMTVVTGTNAGSWSVEDNTGGTTGNAASGTVSTSIHSESANVGDFTLGFYGVYYSAATGNLDVTTSWGTAPNGTGSNPADFTHAHQLLNIQNRAAATISGNWSIASTSKIVTGDGTNPCNFTIPTGFSVTGLVDVSNNATLTLQNTTLPTLGILSGTVAFAGSSAQTIPGSTFTNLTINNASGVTLGASSSVNGIFTLTSGRITTTAANLLTLGAASTVSGGSATSFVNGPVALTARLTVPMVAPIGKGSAYRPLTSVMTSLTGSGTFTAEQFESAPTGTVSITGVDKISNVRYFRVDKSSGITGGSANLTLTWGADDHVTDAAHLTVCGQADGGNWQYQSHASYNLLSPTDGNITAGNNIASNATSNFALGNLTGGTNPLPVNLSSFTAVPSNAAMKLSWTTSVETNNHGFDVERSIDKSVWASLTFIQGQGNSNTAKEYSYSDNSITKAGKYYYRLKQIDNNGGYKFSDITEADYVLPTAYSLNQNYPNPFNPNTMISYSLPLASNVKVSIYNAIGETVQILENGFKSAGNYSVSFNAANMPSGIYFYRIEAGNFSQVRKMMLVK